MCVSAAKMTCDITRVLFKDNGTWADVCRSQTRSEWYPHNKAGLQGQGGSSLRETDFQTV